MGVPIQLGDVQETLLIPLYGRALDARNGTSMLGDTAAADLVDAIDYDFAKFRGPALDGSVMRAAIFDGFVRDFLREHPSGTVVDVGCGLSTRFRRLDNGSVRWFDVDVPDTMALRRTFFEDSDRYAMIDGSIVESDWYGQVGAAGGPVFLVSEAVLMYFPDDTVRPALRSIAEAFAGHQMALDTAGRMMIDNQERNPVFRTVAARMSWACDDPFSLMECGLELLASHTLGSPQRSVARNWPRKYRWGLRLLRWTPLMTVYRMNLYALRRPL